MTQNQRVAPDHPRAGTSDSAEGKLKAVIAHLAAGVGFDAVQCMRVADFGTLPGERLHEFIAEGCHGDMAWMATSAARRAHPLALWPDARSAILLGLSYGPQGDPLAALRQRSRAAISVYAQGKDYHEIIKPRLKQVARSIVAATAAEVKVFVDTAPLMEKALAAQSGLGWQGKHTNLVSRQHGSWLFLGAILTTAEIAPDPPETDHCGSCRRCLDVCPTNAFPAPYRLDARRCISYLTIEHKGPIDRELRAPMGNRIFGCDDCLAVCPWNKFASAAREQRLQSHSGTGSPLLCELLRLDHAGFRERFQGTPVKRTGRDRFMRNVLIAAGNSSDPSLVALVRERLGDASPLVRGAAVWALARLVGREHLHAYAANHREQEADATVQSEWRAELAS